MAPAASSRAAACANTTYVTLLTGQRYADAAMCLPYQLQHVQAKCPILLVYNDADTTLPLPLLKRSYSGHLLPLSRLKARFAKRQAALNDGSNATAVGAAAAATTAAAASSEADGGRRLFAASEMINTHLKLWLWALPVQRAVFLDIDILVLRNVDELLQMRLPPGDVGAVTCKSKYGERFFNSGLLVFSPSLRKLDQLLEAERFATYPWNGHVPHHDEKWPNICAPRHDPYSAKRLFPNSSNPLRVCRSTYGPGRQPSQMIKACESKLTDQSVFNQVYHSHQLVPSSFNDGNRFRLESSHIVHFVGEPKPWDAGAFRSRGADAGRANATHAWRQLCAASPARLQNGVAPLHHHHQHGEHHQGTRSSAGSDQDDGRKSRSSSSGSSRGGRREDSGSSSNGDDGGGGDLLR